MSGERPNDNPNRKNPMDRPNIRLLLTSQHGGPELDATVRELVPQAPDEAWTTDIEKAKELASNMNPGCYLMKMDDGSYVMAETDEFEVIGNPGEQQSPPIVRYEQIDEALLIVQAAFRKALGLTRF